MPVQVEAPLEFGGQAVKEPSKKARLQARVLALSGEGAWAPREPVRMRVRARVAETHYEKLAPLLRLIALERRGGLFELALP